MMWLMTFIKTNKLDFLLTKSNNNERRLLSETISKRVHVGDGRYSAGGAKSSVGSYRQQGWSFGVPLEWEPDFG